MSEKQHYAFNLLEMLGFILYFIFLFVERLLALILSFNTSDFYGLNSNWFFPYMTYVITAISLVVGTILFIKPLIGMFSSIFKKECYDFDNNSKPLIIATTVLLFGGMVHTGFTMPALQFAAYGCLIVLSLVFRCVEAIYNGKDKFSSIMSVIYITTFSMCIPVCYTYSDPSVMTATAISFYVIEFLAIFLLVPAFGLLTYKFFKDGEVSFHICPLLIMLVFCGLVIGLKWNVAVNTFVLIFVGVTLLVYITYYVVKKIVKKA